MIPSRIIAKVQDDFNRLNKDGDKVLNTEKDNIQLSESADFFIAFGKDVDLETFYQYNADKYGEKISEEFNQKREEISKYYKDLSQKKKPSLEAEYRIDPSDKAAVNNFYRNPKEGMIYNYKGIDIKYENGQYCCPEKDYEPSKNIYGVTFQIKQDLYNNFYDKYNSEFDNAKEGEEKDKVIAEFIKGLFDFDGRFDFDNFAANYNTGTKLSQTVIIGTENNKNRVRINFTIGEKEIIVNNYEYKPAS